MEEFDGVDNGVNQYEGNAKYKISSTIGARVGRLNPTWNATDKSPEAEMKGFEKGKLKNYAFETCFLFMSSIFVLHAISWLSGSPNST